MLTRHEPIHHSPGDPVHQGPRGLLAEVLKQNQSLPAVERFSRIEPELRQQRVSKFRDLIPLSQPAEGEQYAFQVDLDRCSACKACVTACHNLNGLAPRENWRWVGWIETLEAERLEPLPVTTACHHCVEPACSHGCPVLAYDKDPQTGAVRHLDDQCIGCQYCQLTCPYDVPAYNPELGIVRKCDLCHDRLAEGEAPACVQACPNRAIEITLVRTHQVREEATSGSSLTPGAAPSAITLPTTRYVTRRSWQEPGAEETPLAPARPHPPLTAMLMGTQAAVGCTLFACVLPSIATPLLIWGAAMLHLSLAASVLHLGRPLAAWRVFLGWRRSWLSREVLTFGALSGAWITGLALPHGFPGLAGSPWMNGLPFLLAGLGLAGVWTSVMVYAATARPCWNRPHVAGNFLGTTLLLGGAFAGALADSGLGSAVPACLGGLRLAWEARQLKLASQESEHPLHQTARLTLGPCRSTWNLELGLRLLAWLIFPAWVVLDHPAGSLLGLLGLLVAEGMERHRFFWSMAGPRLPQPEGGPR